MTKSPTGRLTTSQPEIQNLPNTPAHTLEMYWARHGMVTGRTNCSGAVRTGLFKRIDYSKLEEYHKRGWLVVDARYGLGYYDNMLLWHCECGEIDPWPSQSKPEL